MGVRAAADADPGFVRLGWSRSQSEPELPMHPLIPIEALDTLTDAELLILEARLREILLTQELAESDLARCLLSLRNAVYVRVTRCLARSEIRTP